MDFLPADEGEIQGLIDELNMPAGMIKIYHNGRDMVFNKKKAAMRPPLAHRGRIRTIATLIIGGLLVIWGIWAVMSFFGLDEPQEKAQPSLRDILPEEKSPHAPEKMEMERQEEPQPTITPPSPQEQSAEVKEPQEEKIQSTITQPTPHERPTEMKDTQNSVTPSPQN